MPVCPFAKWLPVPNHSGPMSAHLGLVLHVQVGNGSVFSEFSNPASQASYNWWVAKDGTLEQYVDSDNIAWAQEAGNGTYNSVGTEGMVEEPLSDAQIATISKLYAWGVTQYGWPYGLAEAPGQPGFGWHGMGAPAWGHAECPGLIRRGQRQHILDLAQGGIFAMLNDTEQAELLLKIRELHQYFLAPVADVNAGVPWAVNQALSEIKAIKDKIGA